MSNYRQKIAIIQDTDDAGNTYILDITNDVTKWYRNHYIPNVSFVQEKELNELQIEWTTIKIY